MQKKKSMESNRKGNISDAGVKRYAQKTKQLSSGSNLPVTPTQKELDLLKNVRWVVHLLKRSW